MFRDSHIWACLPGAYYYSTRYARTNERVLHILKYWGAYVLLLAVLGVDMRTYGAVLFLTWLAFMATYDVICRENDVWSVRDELYPCRREWSCDVSPALFFWIRVVWFCGLLVCLALSAGASVYPSLYLALIVVAIIGAVHNRLREPWRPLTHAILYLAKGGVLMVAVLSAMDVGVIHRYILYTLLFNLSYFPSYTVRKVFGLSRQALRPAQIGLFRTLLLQPIVIKTIVLAGLALWDIRFLYLLVWVDVLTLIERAFGRSIQTI